MCARAMGRARADVLFSEAADKTSVPPTPDPVTKKPTELAVVNEVSISNAAGVTGGVLGFVLGGPVIGLVFGAMSLYVSKKDNDGGDALRGIGKSVVQTYNYFTTLNNKYDVTGNVSDKVGKAFDDAAASSESEVFDSIKGAVKKAKDLDAEFDLIGKGTSLVGASATLAEAAIEKVDELNTKYDFVETSKKLASEVAKKAKNAIN